MPPRKALKQRTATERTTIDRGHDRLHHAIERLEPRRLLAAVIGGVVDAVPSGAGGLLTAREAPAVKSKVDPSLLALGRQRAAVVAADPSADLRAFRPADGALVVANDRVAVKVTTDARGTRRTRLEAELRRAGLEIAVDAGGVLVGSVPIGNVERLGAVRGLQSVSAAPAPQTFGGATTTQGDTALRANLARTAGGVDGSGVKIGVISDSFNRSGNGSAAADGASGDLPGFLSPVQVLDDSYAGSDEGRAMMQLIHDIAPGARLAFHTAITVTGAGATLTDAGFAQAIRDLAAAGCDVIVDDIGVSDEPMYMDGLSARAIDEVTAAGVAYFSSAANGGTAAYEGAYVSSGQTITVDGTSAGVAHDFDPGPGVDFRQRITIPLGRSVGIEFQWDQPFGSVTGIDSTSDLDILLVNASTNTIVAAGQIDNLSTGSGDPVEFMGFGNNQGTTQFDVIITYFGGTTVPGRMKYANRQNQINIVEFDTNSSTVYGHQNAVAGASVGAAPWFGTPAFGVNPPVSETFSSAGGTPILFTDAGVRLGAAETRLQPRFTATDGGNTTFFGSDIGQDADAFPNFFGTSAAAPEAAAVAALMLQKNPSATPAELFAALANTAVDMDDQFVAGFQSGYDFGSGAGLIRADAAVAAVTTILPTLLPAGATASFGSVFTYANGTLNLNSGTITFTQDNDAENVTILASGPASRLVFNSKEELVNLTLSNGARASVGNSTSAATRRALVVEGLSVDATSTVDLGNNVLVYRYTGSGGAALNLVTGLVVRGFNGGDWGGTGLASTAAATDPTFATALGVASNADIGYTSMGGETGLTGNEILVKYTYYGDADLSGGVDNSDLLSFQDGLAPASPKVWLSGNFDYDTTIGNSDLLAFQDGLLASRSRGLL